MTSEEASWAGLGPADFNDEPPSPPEQLEQTTRELVAEAARLQYPTEGEFAVRFWEWSNSKNVPCAVAANAMRRA
ncbi:MAG: hypothetical protein ACYCOX_14830, partial [Acidobacteriaceae bacterium]